MLRTVLREARDGGGRPRAAGRNPQGTGGKTMLFGLLMLWLGVAIGLFLGALLGAGGGARRAEDVPPARGAEIIPFRARG